ncbi:MAG: ATP-binding protein [Alcaligenaceae bacterium]|nr:ATP-binding protein [Alcaligenaceae bacterium]
MRFGISLKLFLAILASCIIIALAMGLAVRFSFERGFNSYIHERQQQRLAALTEVLEADYAREGGWDFLRNDNRRWWAVLLDAWRRDDDSDISDDNRGAAGKPGSPPRPHTSLLYEHVALVVGRGSTFERGEHRYSLRVGDQVVGWVVTPRPAARRMNNAIDRRFQNRQLIATWVIVGLSVLLAAVVSLLLARMLLAPVRRITRATDRLAGGDYTVRVESRSSDELGRLARDFNRLAYSLERNEQLRRALMADVSHELRTPLAVLRGEIEALQDGLRAPTPETLASLQHEVLLLSKLIDDLYELSLADAGALNYRMDTMDPAILLGSLVEHYRERFGRRAIDLALTAPHGLTMSGDSQRLTQLFSNILENSLRYTDSPGRVWIELQADGENIRISVEDSAPGVPEALLPRLFERMFRVEASRSREHGGAGLGLAICQRIVEAHGGTITAEHSPLGGVRMVMSFPRTGGGS